MSGVWNFGGEFCISEDVLLKTMRLASTKTEATRKGSFGGQTRDGDAASERGIGTDPSRRV